MIKVELFNEMLDLYEFTLIKYNDNTWGLHDRQGANLGDIESDRFNTITDIIERLEVYHIDYIINAIEENFEIYDYTDYADLHRQCLEKIKNEPLEYLDFNDWDWKILILIANAPNIDIFNAPLDNVALQGLDFDTWE